MENWKISAIEKLKQYEAKRQALEIIPMQIAEIESTMTSIRSGTYVAPVSGGKSIGKENMLLSCIVQKEELQRNLDRVKLWIEFMEKGLSILDEDERLVLDRFFIHPAKGNVDRLCGELFIEQSQVYKRRDKALRKFTLAIYGCTES